MDLKQDRLVRALRQAQHFCSYRERSHSEVKKKLYGLKLYKQDVEEILAALIETDHLNEERYAIQYAGGKFRINQWGKIKINAGLKQQQVSAYCIKKAMASIKEDDYTNLINKLLKKKWAQLSTETNRAIRKNKTRLYLLQKGFEANIIQEVFLKIEEEIIK